MAPVPTLHKLYYFADGNLKLQAEGTVYLVHRYLFIRHSHNFIVKDLTDASNPSPNVEPHFLYGVRPIELDRLLSCLYPRELMVEEARSSEEWTSILKLATKWEFVSLRHRAIRELDSLASPIDKVLLGHEYDIPELRLPAYVDLCRSTVPLSEEDGERLGVKDVVKIYRVRQELWNQGAMPVPLEDIVMKVRIHFSLPAGPSPSCPSSRSISPPAAHVRSLSLSPVTPPHWPPSPRIQLIPASFIKAPQPEAPEPISTPPAAILVQPVPMSLPVTNLAEKGWVEEPSQATSSTAWAASITSGIPSAAVQVTPGPNITSETGKKKKPQKIPPNPPGTGKKAKKKAALAAATATNGT